MKVKANFDYKDIVLKRLVKENEVIEVDEARGKLLTTKKYNGVPFCNIVEEVAEEVKEEVKEPLEENVEDEKPKKKRTRKTKE